MRYIVYSEPSEHGDVEVKMTEAEAIKWQRDYVLKAHNYTYESDQAALKDYIAVNWAYWREEL
jgi:hypothetical protein